MKKAIIKKYIILSLMVISNLFFSQTKGVYQNKEKGKVEKVLEDLNFFADQANFEKYFNLYSEESTFIGTDADEIWNKKEFMAYAKPHFDKGKTWSFISLKRNINFSIDGKYAWFDELLNTQMKLCRGSGVLEKMGTEWKIKQYVLSMTIPNEVSSEVIKIKSSLENDVISVLTAF